MADKTLKPDIDIHLCFLELESGKPELKAVFDGEFEADAWVSGVKAAYMTGYYMTVSPNHGAVDVDTWLKEWREGEQ